MNPIIPATFVTEISDLDDSRRSPSPATLLARQKISKKPSFENLSPQLQVKLKRIKEKVIHLYKGVSLGARPLTKKYVCEYLDRQHRYGRPLDAFFQIWKGSSSNDDFDTWMYKLDLGEDVPGKEQLQEKNLIAEDGKPIKVSSLQYLNEEER